MLSYLLYLADDSIDLNALPHAQASTGELQLVLRVVFAIAGVLALLMLTIAGFRYIISQGDPQATAQAKNAIIYPLVGLAVCVLAEVIVTFVIGNV